MSNFRSKLKPKINILVKGNLLFFSGITFSISSYISYLKFDFSYLFFPLIISSSLSLILVYLISNFKYTMEKINKKKVLLYFLFISSCLFSTILSYYDYLNLRDALLFYYIFFCGILINLITSKYNGALYIYIYGVFIALFIAILTAPFEKLIPPLSGVFNNPNSLGLISSYSLLCLLLLILHKKNPSSSFLIIHYLLILTTFIISLLSLSRTAIFSSLIILVLYFSIQLKFSFKKWIYILITLLLIYYFSNEIIHNALDGIMNKTYNNSNLVSGRDVIAKYYWDQVNAYGAIFFDNRYPVDNTYIKLSIKYGYIPTIIFIYILLLTLISAMKNKILILITTLFILISLMETIYYSVPLLLLIIFSFKRDIKSNDT